MEGVLLSLAQATTQAAPPTLFWRMFPPESVALTVVVISLVAASGLAIGAIRLGGFALGIPGVMFTGLLLGRFIPPGMIQEPVILFVRDFGLILFVYAVGVQVGPGFFASLRQQGLRWNVLAIAIVVLGALLCALVAVLLPRVGVAGAVGIYAGATTNAPAFASATEVIRNVAGAAAPDEIRNVTSPAFAITYPFGLLGVILAMVGVRAIFRISPSREAEFSDVLERGDRPAPAVMNVEVQNANLSGLTVDRIEELQGHGIVISRVLHQGRIDVARPETVITSGNVVLAVGTRDELEAFRLIAGRASDVDLRSVPGEITTREILVTNEPVLNKPVDDLNLSQRLGVTITRVRRGEVEFTAVGHVQLHFGDRVLAVGEAVALDQAANELGNSVRKLNLPRLLPIFIGLLLGVTVGSIPLSFPGLPVPVKLGLAAGPMIIAILLARMGRLGSLIWYMPYSGSQLMRELGIALFLIAVGLLAGNGFFATIWSLMGLKLLLLGVLITMIPLMAAGIFARMVWKMNFHYVCGILAGSMTSPSLAFVHTMSHSESPALAFATVYPLTMILRVLCGQLLVLLLM